MRRLYLIKWTDLDKFGQKYDWIVDDFDNNYWPWETMIQSKIGDFLIIYMDLKNKELIGTVSIKKLNSKSKTQQGLNSVKGTIIDIKNVWIFPNYRGKGYCVKMLKRLKQLIKRRSLGDKLKLDVVENNQKAIRCYNHILKRYENTDAENKLHTNFKSRYGFDPGDRKFIIMIGNS